MSIFPAALVVVCVAVAPVASWAQARNGNVYNGTAHQPSAGVQANERAAGIAPSDSTVQQENHDLAAINNQLLDRANKDGNANPSARTTVFGVQPGGVVQASPNAGSSSSTVGR